jgi:hypothetical protein
VGNPMPETYHGWGWFTPPIKKCDFGLIVGFTTLMFLEFFRVSGMFFMSMEWFVGKIQE